MPLHPQAEGLLAAMQAQGAPPLEELSVPFVRQMAMAYTTMQGEPEPVAKVEDLVVPGPAGSLPVRVYTPEGSGPFPLVVYFHGGGWVIGNVELVDRPCRHLANTTGAVVASVEYRLSPETKYPGPAEDCYAVTAWLAEHAGDFSADAGRLVVSGDSAGGNLAAVVSLMARDRGGPPIALQALLYPVTAPADGTEFASYVDSGDGYLLTRGAMVWFWDHYLQSPEQAKEAYAAPLHAESLEGLPPALVIVAGYDPLRDEGIAYAERLEAAGVPVTLHRHDDQMHGFFWMGGVLDAAGEAADEVAASMKEHLKA